MVLERVSLEGAGAQLQIGQISDVDFRGTGVRERRAGRLLGAIPLDLLVVTGDLLEFRGRVAPERVDQAISFVESIPARRGRYWVVGESEAHHREAISRALRGRAVRLLWNEEVRFDVQGHKVSLFGVAKTEARFEASRLESAPAIRARSAGLLSPLIDGEPGAAMLHDYEIVGTLRFGDPEDFVGAVIYSPPGRPDRGYALVRHGMRKEFHLRRLDGAPLREIRREGRVEPVGRTIHYRLRASTGSDGVRLQARTWTAGSAEGEDWQMEAVDRAADRSAAGAPGICAKGGADDRFFGPWTAYRIADGARLAGRDLEGFRMNDGSWRFLSILRDWAKPEEGPRPLRLLLAHNPDVVLTLEDQGAGDVDLILSGHTQGGQVRLPFVGALYTGTEIGPAYASGLLSHGGRRLYVNRGLGTSLLPIRFLCPPEVTWLSVPLGLREAS